MAELVRCPAMDKSLKIFLHSIPDSDFKFNETEDLVKIPKSLYHKLLRKEAQISLLKKHHDFDDKRKKEIRVSEEEGSLFHQHSKITRRRNHTRTNEILVLVETTSEANSASSTPGGYDSVLDSSSDENTSDSSAEIRDDSDGDSDDSDDDSDSSSCYKTWTEEQYL
ncbi:hypothetical protein U1Q18_049575 [Sarracenia purpurea var. burkii]